MIQELINAAAIGSDVFVPAGRYVEAVNVNKKVNLKVTGGTVTLDKKQLQVTASGTTVSDFTVDGYDCGEPLYHNNDGHKAGGQWDTAGVLIKADNVTLTRVHGDNCGGTGVGIGGQDQPRVWRTGVKLIDCGAKNNGRNGLSCSCCKGLVLENFDNGPANNRRKMVMEWESSQKFYICEDVTVAGGKWHGNLGPGQWFDYQCRRISVKKADFFDNAPWNTTSAWAAPGSNFEISEGPILYEECWFHNSAPSSGGCGLLESCKPPPGSSSPLAEIRFRRCKFEGTTLYLRDNTNRGYRLGGIVLENNEIFGATFPKNAAVIETGTIVAAQSGPPSSWEPTPPVDPPVSIQRSAVKVEPVTKITYDDGSVQIL